MSQTVDELPHLTPSENRLAGLFGRPRRLAVVAIGVLTGVGWVYLGLMVAGLVWSGPAGRLGPGMELVDLLVRPEGRDLLGQSLLDALCRPSFGDADNAAGLALAFAATLAMWGAMALAMMLPTAAPMIVSYAEIAETAAAKGEKAVTPLMIMAGYGTVWLAFSILATALQVALSRAALLDSSMASASGLFTGGIFIAAGAYQFSELKHACVTRCQRPLPFFFANWTTAPRGVFGLGFKQGLYCLGCCGATMLVMFGVGVMNIVWMALLGAVMATEKLLTTTRFSRVIGVILIAVGIGFIVSAVMAHWPGRGA